MVNTIRILGRYGVSIKIGNIVMEHGLMLAPMAGFTDRSFRRICRSCGAEYTVSEMVSAKALCYEQLMKKNREAVVLKTAPLANVEPNELPMAIQLFGNDPDCVAEAALMIEECSYLGCASDTAPSAIDINMGCPVRKIVSNGEGSALMKDPSLAMRIVSKTVKTLKHTPVTVKIRAGWDEHNKNAAELAKALESVGASMICVHARTREQMYAPGIDLNIIESVKSSVSVPVVGNGDVLCAADAVKMMKKTGCDGVMIGRGALGDPWIFDEIASAMDGNDFISPDIQARLDMCISHVIAIRQDKGSIIGASEIKKHAVLYIKGVHSAASVRDRIMRANDTDEILEILYELKKSYA